MKKFAFIFSITCLAYMLGNINMIAQNPRAVYYEKQEIVLNDFKANGFILDIGGGGEGVIGQLKGEQAISIDISEDELVNAPSTNLKIVMDATDLKFIDNSFNTVAIFYTLMYIKGLDHEKVFKEAKRVLKHGGRLLIWDVNLAVSKDISKLYGVYPFKFELPKTEINTGYGVRFPKKHDHNMQYYVNLAKKTDFKVVTATNNHPSFYLELKTPPAITDTLAELIDNKGIDFTIKNYNQLKRTKAKEFYFGADVLIKLSNHLVSSNKATEAVEIFKLAVKEYPIEERKINSFGYKLLGEKKNKEAIEVFKINVEKHPNSANVFDSLAEAYMNNNQNELAIKNYQKSLELNPDNANATEMLKKLKNR